MVLDVYTSGQKLQNKFRRELLYVKLQCSCIHVYSTVAAAESSLNSLAKLNLNNRQHKFRLCRNHLVYIYIPTQLCGCVMDVLTCLAFLHVRSTHDHSRASDDFFA